MGTNFDRKILILNGFDTGLDEFVGTHEVVIEPDGSPDGQQQKYLGRDEKASYPETGPYTPEKPTPGAEP